jgi:hypothetical protein
MELTGIAGNIVGWAVIIIAYAIVITGIFCVAHYFLFDILLRKVCQWFKVWHRLIQFIYLRKDFLEWVRNKEKKLRTPITTPNDEVSDTIAADSSRGDDKQVIKLKAEYGKQV